MKNIFETLSGYFVVKDDEFLTIDSSVNKISSIVGYSVEEIEKLFQNRLMNLILFEDRSLVRKIAEEQIADTGVAEVSCRVKHKDGNVIWVYAKLAEFVDEGEHKIAGIIIDATRTMELQNHTEKILKRYQIILSQTENIIFEYDIESDSLELSDTWEQIFGYKPSTKDFFATLDPVSHMHSEDKIDLVQHIQRIKKGAGYQSMEARIANIHGEYIWTRIRATPLLDENGKLTSIVGVILNIDEEKKASIAIKERAEQDALTKLLNNETARNEVEEYLRSYTDTAVSSLLIIDLDNFKHINDHYGHLYGDKFLIHTAGEIRKLFRSDDIVARIGGDEFMVLMKEVASPELVERRCVQLISALSETLHSSCSIGVAFSPNHGTTYADLFQCADKALYAAKANGKSCYVIYDKKLA